METMKDVALAMGVDTSESPLSSSAFNGAPASDDRSHRPNGADSRLIDVNDDSSDEDEEQTKNATAASARSDEGRQRKRRVVAAAARKRISNQDAATPCATNPMLVLPVRSNSRLLSPARRRRGVSTGVSRSLNSKTSVFTKIREFKVDFVLPSGSLLPYTCQGDWTVEQIKNEVWTIMRDYNLLDECLENMDSYVFKYEKDSDAYELYEERQIFQTLSVVMYWRARNVDAGQFEIVPIRVETAQEIEMNREIGRLIGINLTELSTRKKDEVTTVRRIFVGVRRSAVSSRDPSYYSMEPELCLTPIPFHIKQALDSSSGKIILKVHSGKVFTAMKVPHSYTPFQILQEFFPTDARKKQRLNLREDSKIQDYILKVCGRNIFLTGPDRIVDFLYVRNCLATSRCIYLAVVPCVDVEKDKPRNVPEPDLIDDYTGLAGSYKQLSALTKDHTQVFSLASWDIGQKFRVFVKGIDDLEGESDCVSLRIEIGISHGGKPLVHSRKTKEIRYARYPRWSEYLTFDIKTKNLPKSARLFCNVLVRKPDVKKQKRFSTLPRNYNIDDFGKWGESIQKVYHATLQLFDYRSILQQGQLQLSMHGGGGDVTSATRSSSFFPSLHVEFSRYAHPVAYPNSDSGWSLSNRQNGHLSRSPMTTKSRFMAMIREIISSDPLKELEVHECELLWRFRWSLVEIPEALPWLLRCVDWGSLESVVEIHKLLQDWKSSEITLEVALQLLNSNCVDEKVRSLAVDRLERLSNDEMLFYLLQLVQVLKFEPYHDSALARFLLRRALGSKRIGHYFYWFLRSEMDFPEFRDRFGLLLEAYLRGCGEATLSDIKNQHQVFNYLAQVAVKLKSGDKKDRAGFLLESLRDFDVPKTFSPAYDPSTSIGDLQIGNCKFMDSKKMPLWLEFTNMDPTAIEKEAVQLIFKHGDDLRQDMLTLQMLKLMDKLWKEEGLNLYIFPYGCMSTGFEVGMIEVVPNSSTVAKIQRMFGGSFGAFKDDCLCNWLKKHNPRASDFQAAVKRFTLSCAGYCVATFVLGIGDRHNDNILLTKSGNLVHIDFGHFLGNTKTFMGIKRERAPFVLTPDFVYIMGKKNGEMFRTFQDTCAKAFNVIRRHAHLFINLFSMMKHTGIPELRSVEDIDYLRNILVLNKSEPDAAKYFRDKIDECLRLNWSTQLNWLAHNVVH
ncbi:phosphatidylinositol 4,5-bisphosphate 3-kinase catalytic subunit gamma isoform-like isoform X2 [Oscarella lobularis]|uniref:phosphatidylinositol 4,5-bisphosphate 3-kinase catalytic subunit gamma isoform-like isoform X2 n=1 Tax=Oscarella lobularis TaxID=121494 RepID=UPI003313A3E9